MSKTIEERLQVLEDREEIIKLKARYVNYNDGGTATGHWHALVTATLPDKSAIWIRGL